MKIKGVTWRALTAYDLKAVEAIAAEVHPAFFEAPEVLAEKHALYHNGAYLLEIGERPAGYVLSHPWRAGTIPPLNRTVGALPDVTDTYYLHDLALLPVARRIGAASFIVEALIKHAAARRYATMSLVAVNDSLGFWEKHGFNVENAPSLADQLRGYGEAAQLMTRPL